MQEDTDNTSPSLSVSSLTPSVFDVSVWEGFQLNKKNNETSFLHYLLPYKQSQAGRFLSLRRKTSRFSFRKRTTGEETSESQPKPPSNAVVDVHSASAVSSAECSSSLSHTDADSAQLKKQFNIPSTESSLSLVQYNTEAMSPSKTHSIKTLQSSFMPNNTTESPSVATSTGLEELATPGNAVRKNNEEDQSFQDPLFFPSGFVPSVSHCIVDCTPQLQIFPHSLYNIMAVMSPTSFSIVSTPHLDLLQAIFEPFSVPLNARMTSELFPLRLEDAYNAFGKHLSPNAELSLAPTDTLLSASWHRESLTLAVGSLNCLFVFRAPFSAVCRNSHVLPTNIMANVFPPDATRGTFLFECVFFTLLSWPCYSVMWINDDLLTKGTNYDLVNEKGKLVGNVNCDATNKSVITSQFFIWRCKFSRNSQTRGSTKVINHEQFSVTGSSLYSTPDLFASFVKSYPIIRDNWCSDHALPEFLQCEHTPFSSWRAAVGCGDKQLSPLPILRNDPCSGDHGDERFSVELQRLVPHPGNRFVAALHILSAKGNHHNDTVSEHFAYALPSPIVRIWSLRSPLACRRSSVTSDSDSDASDRIPEHASTWRRVPFCKKRKFRSFLEKKSQILNKFCPSLNIASLFSFHQKRKQKTTSTGANTTYYGSTSSDLDDTVRYPNGELQASELAIVKQLTSITEAHWRSSSTVGMSTRMSSSLGHKVSLLTLMAAQGLINDTDLETFQNATVFNTPITANGMEARQRLEAFVGRTTGVADDVITPNYGDIMNRGPPSSVVEGHYMTTTLNHRAPVLDLVWRDTGAVTDIVFVPAVLCALTLDNCFTIWLESPLNTVLRFEPVIMFRLQSSPISHFLHPLDPVLQPEQSLDVTQVSTPQVHSIAPMCAPAYAAQDDWADRSQVPGFVTVIRNPGITFCWLTTHRVNYDAWHIDNLLRLCRAEAKTRYVDLDLLHCGTLADQLNTGETPSYGRFGMDRFRQFIYRRSGISRVTSEGSSDGSQNIRSDTLSLRPSAHLCELDFFHPELYRTMTSQINLQSPLSYSSGLKLTELPGLSTPLAPVSQVNRVIDFLLIAETAQKDYDTPLLSGGCGLWVYTIRDLGNAPVSTTSPAVKLLLEPRNLPLPCRVRTLVTAECVPSFGFSVSFLADSRISCTKGVPVPVTDGIILPACYVVLITFSGEVWNCVIRPNITSRLTEQHTKNSIHVQYEIVLHSVYAGLFRSVFCFRTQLLPASPSAALKFRTLEMLDSDKNHDFPSPNCSLNEKLLPIEWTLLEEHPYIPRILLALDNRGRLSIGWLDFADPQQNDVEWDILIARNSSSYYSSNYESTIISDQTSITPEETLLNFSHKATLPSFSAYPSGSIKPTSSMRQNFLSFASKARRLISLHSLTTHWINMYPEVSSNACSVPTSNFAPDASVNTQKSDFLTAKKDVTPRLPPFRHAIWLPLRGKPAVALSVVEPSGKLLAFELTTGVPGHPPRLRCLPIVGPYSKLLSVVREPDFLQTEKQRRSCNVTQTDEKKFAVLHVQAVVQKEENCLLLIRAAKVALDQPNASNSNSEDPKSNENIFFFSCQRFHRDPLESETTNVKTQSAGKTTLGVLQLSLIYKGTLNYSNSVLDLRGTFDGDFDRVEKVSQTSVEVVPQLFFSPNCMIGRVLATFACYPPLDCSLPSFIRRPERCSFVGLYQIVDLNIKPLAYACVATQRLILGTTGNYHKIYVDDPVVGLTVNEECLAVLTASGRLSLFSLLNLPAVLNCPQTPLELAVIASHDSNIPTSSNNSHISSRSESSQTTFFPVIRPIRVVDLQSSVLKLSTLVRQFASLQRNLSCQGSRTSATTLANVNSNNGSRGTPPTPRSVSAHDGNEANASCYRPQTRQERWHSRQTLRKSNINQQDFHTSRCQSLWSTLLQPQQLGDSPYLSLRVTKGDGLMLLVVLRTGQANVLHDGSTIHAGLHCIPSIFIRSRTRGTDIWSKPPQSIFDKFFSDPEGKAPNNESNSFNRLTSSIGWATHSSQLLLGLSPLCNGPFSEPLRPPMAVGVPVSLRTLAASVAAPRAVYHPEVLSSHLRLFRWSRIVLIVLKKLFEGLMRWKKHHRGHVLSPTLDLPLPLLSALLRFNSEVKSIPDSCPSTTPRRDKSFDVTSCTEDSEAGSNLLDLNYCLNQHSSISPNELSELITLLDVTRKENLHWLEMNGTLLPHLTLDETVALCGLVKFLSFLFPQRQLEDAKSEPNVPSEFEQEDILYSIIKAEERLRTGSATYRQAVAECDVAGTRFLVGYGIAVSATITVEHVKSTISELKLAAAQNDDSYLPTPFAPEEDSVSASKPSPLQKAKTSVSKFSHALCLLEHQFANLTFSSVDDVLSLTTHDVAWALQSDADQSLLQRVLFLQRHLSTGEAFSKNQNVITAQPSGFVTWTMLQQAGAGVWLQHPETIWRLASEKIPKTAYALQKPDERNPDHVALWYIATNRIPLLRALYQAQKNSKVVEFLSHDFEEERWKEAASKNAYALVKQKRYLLAVGFFLLGQAYTEAVDVCCGHLKDPQLALFLLRILLCAALRVSRNNKDILLQLMESVICDKLLPFAQQYRDTWLEASLHWLHGAYADAVICTLPSTLRPTVSADASCTGLDMRNSMDDRYFSPDALDAPFYHKIYERFCASSTDQDYNATVIYPLKRLGHASAMQPFRRHLLSTLPIRRLLQQYTQHQSVSNLPTPLTARSSHSILDTRNSEENNKTPFYGKDQSKAYMDVAASEHQRFITREKLCWIIGRTESFLEKASYHDAFLEAVRGDRYPFSLLPLSAMFLWSSASTLYRITYDATLVGSRTTWKHVCRALKRITETASCQLIEEPRLSFDVSWCTSHSADYFVHWLDKQQKKFEHGFKSKEFGVSQNTERSRPDASVSGQLHGDEGNRGLHYPVLYSIRRSLNYQLKWGPRVDFVETFEWNRPDHPRHFSVLFGWLQAIRNLFPLLLALRHRDGCLVLTPQSSSISNLETILSSLLILLGWVRSMASFYSASSVVPLLGIVSATLALCGSSVLLLNEPPVPIVSDVTPSTPTPRPEETTSSASVPPVERSPTKLVSSCAANAPLSYWLRSYHVISKLRSFGCLLEEKKIREAIDDAFHCVPGDLLAVLMYRNSYFVELCQKGGQDTLPFLSSSLSINISQRRELLWTFLQETIRSAWYDQILWILRNTLDVSEILLSKFSNLHTSNSFSGKTSISSSTTVPQNEKRYCVSQIGCESAESPPLNKQHFIKTSPSNVFYPSLLHLVSSLRGTLHLLESLIGAEYRISKMTQLAITTTLEFPYFVSFMWPSITVAGPSNEASLHSNRFSIRPQCLAENSALSPYENVKEHNGSRARWFSLIKDTTGYTAQQTAAIHYVWKVLDCTFRLELLLARGPLHYLPSIFSHLIPFSVVDTASRRVANIRELPSCISLDRTQFTRRLHHIPTLFGSSLAVPSGAPVGLGGLGQRTFFLTASSAMGCLLVATNKGIWETDVTQGLLLSSDGATQQTTNDAPLSLPGRSARNLLRVANGTHLQNHHASSSHGKPTTPTLKHNNHHSAHHALAPPLHVFDSDHAHIRAPSTHRVGLPLDRKYAVTYEETLSRYVRTVFGPFQLEDTAPGFVLNKELNNEVVLRHEPPKHHLHYADKELSIQSSCTAVPMDSKQNHAKGMSGNMGVTARSHPLLLHDPVNERRFHRIAHREEAGRLLSHVVHIKKQNVSLGASNESSDLKSNTIFDSNGTLQVGNHNECDTTEPKLPVAPNLNTIAGDVLENETGNPSSIDDVTASHFSCQLKREFFLRGFFSTLSAFLAPTIDVHGDGSHTLCEIAPHHLHLLMSGFSCVPHFHQPDTRESEGSLSDELDATTPRVYFSAATWLQFVALLQGHDTEDILRHFIHHLMSPPISLSQTKLKKTDSSTSHHDTFAVSFLEAHPFLPLSAGAVANSYHHHHMSHSAFFGHDVHETMPIIAFWRFGFPSDRFLGTLYLPSLPARHHTAPTTHRTHTRSRPVDPGDPTSVASVEQRATSSALFSWKHRNSPSTQLLPFSPTEHQEQFSASFPSTVPTFTGIEYGDHPPTYQEAGPLQCLQWSETGEHLVAAHTKGWVTIWRLLETAALTCATGSTVHFQQRFAEEKREWEDRMLLPPPNPQSSATLLRPVPWAFHAHSGFCRYASLVGSDPSDTLLLVTIGRGLPLARLHRPHQEKPPQRLGNLGSMLKPRRPSFSSSFNVHDMVTVPQDMGVVCVWDISSLRKKHERLCSSRAARSFFRNESDFGKGVSDDKLVSPLLVLVDTHFDRGNEPTYAVVWAARQCLLYSTHSGEIRLLNFRRPEQPPLYILNPQYAVPPAVGLGVDEAQKQTLHEASNEPFTSLWCAKSILKFFLFESTQRLVVCYEDAMIRVWDVSALCTTFFSKTGKLLPLISAPPLDRGVTAVLPAFLPPRSKKIKQRRCSNSFWNLPLLWETPEAVHKQDSSKLSLLTTMLGAVFNVGSASSSRILLDAHAAGQQHIISLGADGNVMLTRLM